MVAQAGGCSAALRVENSLVLKQRLACFLIYVIFIYGSLQLLLDHGLGIEAHIVICLAVIVEVGLHYAPRDLVAYGVVLV